MFTVETKQLIKRFIGKTMNSFPSGNGKELSVILNYHSVNPTNSNSTKPGDFLQQMEYVSSNFSVISLPEFVVLRNRGKNIPSKLAMVTLDDGFGDNFQYAFPILKKFDIPATIFITTAFIDGEADIAHRDVTYAGLRPMTWEQIKLMHQEGILFGSHTHTHSILTCISLLEAEKEIAISKKILREELGDDAVSFAYPLGQPLAFNEKIKQLLRKYNFQLACSTIWGSDNSTTDMLELRRIRIDPWDTFNDFNAKVNGQWDYIGWFQNVFRSR